MCRGMRNHFYEYLCYEGYEIYCYLGCLFVKLTHVVSFRSAVLQIYSIAADLLLSVDTKATAIHQSAFPHLGNRLPHHSPNFLSGGKNKVGKRVFSR